MNGHPSDDYRDPAVNAQIWRTAAEIFARHGVDFASARRASGWSNATWIAGGLALRLAVEPGQEKIRREAQVAKLLPAEVGYPTLVECGCQDGYEWSLSLEIPGQSLAEAWGQLGSGARCTALGQVWQKVEAAHRVTAEAAAGAARTRAWFNSCDAAEAAASTARMVQQGVLNVQQAAVLQDILGNLWRALPEAPQVLNHGDLTFDNVLWHNGQVVSLLDFEFAVIAPRELDLNSLLKLAYAPDDASGSPAGRQRLQQTAAAIALPLLADPGSRARLLGYAVLLELWLLQEWLAHPEGEEGPPETWMPYRMLTALAEGRGGHLAPLLGG